MRLSIVLLCIIIFFASSYACASENQVSKASFTLTKQKCDLPEKIIFKIFVNQFRLEFLIDNKSDEKWDLEIKKSLITFPAAEWESPILDNHMGKPSQRVIVFNPGRKSVELYPASLIKETDEDLKGVHWEEWPGKDSDIYNFSFVFSNSKGEEIQCQYSGLISVKAR